MLPKLLLLLLWCMEAALLTANKYIRACSLLQLVGVGVGLAGLAVGIAIPVFYEIQVKGSVSGTSSFRKRD